MTSRPAWRHSRTLLALPALLLVAASCETKLDCAGTPPTISASTSSTPSSPEGVSLVQLIANPIRYQGRSVRVVGYVELAFEGTAVYLHQEDYARAITKNALWLDVGRPDAGESAFEGHAIVEGKFDSTKLGHLDLFSGAIEDVTRLDPWRAPR